jgi:hypothetical protein
MSIRLKSRREAPPNGFIFTIPQAGVQNNQSWSFAEAVDKYITIARANPRLRLPTDRTTVENLIDEQNAMRVLQIKGADIYTTISGSAPPPKMILPRNLAPSAGAGSNIASGVELLTDWLGSGKKPVAADLAVKRAATCADCPMNKPGDWTKIFTIPASASIRKMLSMKHDMSLATPDDDKLEICDACLCPLKLKVWVPIDLIRSHTTTEKLNSFHEGCWIRSELS